MLEPELTKFNSEQCALITAVCEGINFDYHHLKAHGSSCLIYVADDQVLSLVFDVFDAAKVLIVFACSSPDGTIYTSELRFGSYIPNDVIGSCVAGLLRHEFFGWRESDESEDEDESADVYPDDEEE